MASATPTKSGTETLVNTKTAGGQLYSKGAALSDGQYVVVWSDEHTDGRSGNVSYDVRGQMLTASGQKIGSEFEVGSGGTLGKGMPKVTGLLTGGFAVAWEDVGTQPTDNVDNVVHGQVFARPDQTTGPEFIANTINPGWQIDAEITGLSSGQFLLTWSDKNGGLGDTAGYATLGQLYNATGQTIGSSFLVNTTTLGNQVYSQSTPLADGGFVVVWQNDGDGPVVLRAQKFSADGQKVGGEFLADPTPTGSPGSPSIASLSTGGFVITWTEGGKISGQAFNANAEKVGSDFILGAAGGTLSSVAGLGGGKFVVTWNDAATSSLHGQTFNASGQKVGDEFQVNTTRSPDKSDIVASLDGSTFLVTWTDTSTIGSGDSSSSAIRSQLFTVNRPPTVTVTAAGGVAQVTGGTTTALNQWMGAGDPDGDSSQVRVTVLGQGGTLLQNGVAVSGNQALVSLQDFSTLSFAGATTAGSSTVQIAAFDGAEWSDTATMTVTTVAAANAVITGTAAADTLTGTTAAESFSGLAGNDTMQGGGGNDQFDGGAGTDVAILGATGGTVTVTNVETVQGGTGVDAVTLNGQASVYNLVTLSGVETVIGGLGIDVPILGSAGATILAANVEYVIGGAGTDVVTLGSLGGIVTMRGVETLIGGGGLDIPILGDGGNSLLVQPGVEYLIGGAGTDLVILGAGGLSLTVRGLETIIGGSGNDSLILGNSDNVVWLSGIETLTGGLGVDVPILGDGGSTMTVANLEYLIGGAGTDVVTLGGNGGMITVRGLETVIGSQGIDIVVLGNSGNTLLAQSGLEYVIGGDGIDVVTLASGGSTTIVRGLETVIGGTGRDILQLGNSINQLTASGIETLTGGISADTVTFTGATAVSVEGGSGPDALTFGVGVAGNRIVYRSVEDGASVGTVVGYDTIANFDANDQIVLTGQFASFVDRNGDGVLQGGVRGQNGVALASDEVVILSPSLTSLTGDLTVLRSAIGKTTEGQAGNSFLAIAHDAANSAAYLVTDANGDGWIAGNEVRLLGLFSGTSSIEISQVIIG